ncbi:MAG: hypothetical protein M1427_04435 [Candidatus Thermoplasmatota archaeon]|nr:hypothetical protein [Candidatus Thermoplasmatota archaeon]
MRKLYLAGAGNVSKNLLSLISNLNSDIKIMGIENSRGQLFSEESLSMADINNFMKSPQDYRKSVNISKMDFDIYVDMRTASKNGERERDDYINLMKNGKHIVTANKSGLANFFPEIGKASSEFDKKLYFEATVAGGLPVFSLIRSSFPSFTVNSFTGVVNLTSNFVMKKVNDGMNLEEAKRKAMEEGVAETDMTDDLDGTDSARKAVIIANSLFHKPMRLKDLKYSGIDENNIKKNEMLLAKISMNKEFSVESRVFTLNSEDPFLKLAPMGMACSIGFKERNPVYISEDMDGPLETAGAVLSDILSV